MKTSIATVSISGTLEEKLRAVAAAGFDAVEIFENDLLTFPGTPRDVGRMVRDLGMQVSLFQPFRDLEGLPEPLRTRAFDRMARKFDVMAELGTDLILLCSNCSTSTMACRSTTCRRSANWPPAIRCGLATKRWPGAAMSTITATRGAWCATSIIRTSA